MLPAPGGILLRNDQGAILGATGVSGDSLDVDEACAIVAAPQGRLFPEPELVRLPSTVL